MKLAPKARWLIICVGLFCTLLMAGMAIAAFKYGNTILEIFSPVMVVASICVVIGGVRNHCVVQDGIVRGMGKPFGIVDARVVIGPSEPGFYTPWRIQATTENGEHVFLPRTFANFSRTKAPALAVRICDEIRRGIPGGQAAVSADLRDQ